MPHLRVTDQRAREWQMRTPVRRENLRLTTCLPSGVSSHEVRDYRTEYRVWVAATGPPQLASAFAAAAAGIAAVVAVAATIVAATVSAIARDWAAGAVSGVIACWQMNASAADAAVAEGDSCARGCEAIADHARTPGATRCSPGGLCPRRRCAPSSGSPVASSWARLSRTWALETLSTHEGFGRRRCCIARQKMLTPMVFSASCRLWEARVNPAPGFAECGVEAVATACAEDDVAAVASSAARSVPKMVLPAEYYGPECHCSSIVQAAQACD